jgi:hypothetical protein
MDQNMLVTIDEDSLDQVSGGTCLPSPCDVINGVIGVAGQVVSDVSDVLDCGVQTLESLFGCGGSQ